VLKKEERRGRGKKVFCSEKHKNKQTHTHKKSETSITSPRPPPPPRSKTAPLGLARAALRRLARSPISPQRNSSKVALGRRSGRLLFSSSPPSAMAAISIKTEGGGVALPAPTSSSPALFLADVKKDVEDLAKEPLGASYEPRPGPEFEEKEIEGVSFFFLFEFRPSTFSPFDPRYLITPLSSLRLLLRSPLSTLHSPLRSGPPSSSGTTQTTASSPGGATRTPSSPRGKDTSPKETRARRSTSRSSASSTASGSARSCRSRRSSTA